MLAGLLLSPILLPGLIISGLFVLAASRVGLRRLTHPAPRSVHQTPPRQRGAAATAAEELHALLYPGKRIQLEQRRIESVLPEADDPSSPARTGVDLEAGTATLRKSQPL